MTNILNSTLPPQSSGLTPGKNTTTLSGTWLFVPVQALPITLPGPSQSWGRVRKDSPTATRIHRLNKEGGGVSSDKLKHMDSEGIVQTLGILYVLKYL